MSCSYACADVTITKFANERLVDAQHGRHAIDVTAAFPDVAATVPRIGVDTVTTHGADTIMLKNVATLGVNDFHIS